VTSTHCSDHCAIDFGTSNSSLALPDARAPGGSRLIALEAGEATMPTAVFYFTDPDPDDLPADADRSVTPPRAYGRGAVRAYVDGHHGRLMRSMKSILGSSLVDQTTDLGEGHAVKYIDVIAGYLRHLKRRGEAECGGELTRLVLGRPVYFVDDDAERDGHAQAALAAAAHAVGFDEVHFQFEPIAAALDYERQVAAEQIVLVADIGGGTSDFSIVRVGPARAPRLDRRGDVLANHGVHVAGTDFDRHLQLAHVMPLLGLGALGPASPGRAPREVPSGVYFDLATWHLINRVYRPQRVAELRRMADFYDDPLLHRRLMQVVDLRLGHALAARSEAAKIEAARVGGATIDLAAVEAGLTVFVDEAGAIGAIARDLEQIERAAHDTLRLAGLTPQDIDALYFTGGSTGLAPLTRRIAQGFPQARIVSGDRLASVAAGLGLTAQRRFGGSVHPGDGAASS
jgi:hypothetical chaperone protein